MTAPAALSRLDDGHATAQDRVIADLFDVHASDHWYRAQQCCGCGKRGEGAECGSCTAEWDRFIVRTGDL